MRVVFIALAGAMLRTMRPMTTSPRDDEMLTTGEAARLLDSSRQHVVDLCNRGDLPYTTVGKHRRVRRADVLALQSRTRRMSRDQKRSLWLAYAVAGRIVKDPERARAIALRNIETMRTKTRGRPRRWLDQWEVLLQGSMPALLSRLTAHDPQARELRQNAPFAGVLSEKERQQALRAWREHGQA